MRLTYWLWLVHDVAGDPVDRIRYRPDDMARGDDVMYDDGEHDDDNPYDVTYEHLVSRGQTIVAVF